MKVYENVYTTQNYDKILPDLLGVIDKIDMYLDSKNLSKNQRVIVDVSDNPVRVSFIIQPA